MFEDLINSPLVRGLILYLVLPNLVFILLSREFFINRALINSDYLLLWVASCYLSRWVTAFLYAGLVALDLVLSTESIYHYSTVETILALRDIFEFNPLLLYTITGLVLLLALATFVVTRRLGAARPHLSHRYQVLIGIAGVALTGATVARSVDPIDVYSSSFRDSAFVASGITEVGLSSLQLATTTRKNQVIFPAPGAATSHLARDISLQRNSALPYDIVVIVLESQGLLRNEADMRRVFAPLTDPEVNARYVVERGAVQFHGATIFGELRTLCRVYMPHFVPSKLPALGRCLPNMLRRLGYETVSYHGYERWFYERQNWYPKLGIQRSNFADDMMKLSPPRCGGHSLFPGICDLWIAGQVERELSQPRSKPKFIYWLTLNTHLPVDSELASASSFNCAGTESLREDISPCELERINFQLYVRIRQMLLNKDLPPARFLLVGDHMPPFPTLSERALYDHEKVPFLEFIPRSAPLASASVSPY